MGLIDSIGMSNHVGHVARQYRSAAASLGGRSTWHADGDGDAASVIPDVAQVDAGLGQRAPTTRSHGLSGTLANLGISSGRRAQPDQWSNWLDEQTCTPGAKAEPTSLEQLVVVIQEAGSRGQRVRAVGSGHSMSDVARTDGAVLVNPHLMSAIMDVDPATLNAGLGSAPLVRVQGGILIKDLNQQLDERRLALTHMGAYDGQTISGALSTGTHGSGAQWGPMASMLRSIVMVIENGTVVQVEPARGRGGAITDPARFGGRVPEAPGVPVVLVQDDDWFNAAQVSMGCLGVIYSYTIEVTRSFHVSENRTAVRWEDVREQFAPERFDPLPAPLAGWDHFELVISPYADGGDNKHPCIWVERARAGETPKRGTRQDFWGRLLEAVGILLTGILDDILNVFPRLAPSSINAAMDTLETDDAPYIDSSYVVFKALDSELQLKAHAVELHFEARDLVATVDRLVASFQAIADARNVWVAGPIGIRFVAASSALLAPQAGRLTATAELTNIVGIDKGVELLQELKSIMSAGDSTIRVHWGLDLDTITPQNVAEWYGPNLDRWLAVYREVNRNGMFNNKFTDRIGISV